MPGGETLDLQGLRRDFGGFAALKGIDLRIAPGEFVALLGPSGCGKTTALNCIAGLMPLSGGAITLGARRVDQLPPEHRGFGMVFQSYALFPHMSARRNVGFGLAMQKVPRREAEARIDEALALVRLTAQADKLPGQMSGGQQQRVAIARAVVIRPPVVLMDEPLSNLDAKLRLEMRAEIRRIHETIGSTTIYVTHDQDEALSMADRVVVMRDGMIRQTGTPEDLYERPAHVDVAEFMGFRTRMVGRVLAADDRQASVDIGGTTIAVALRAPVAADQAVTLMVRPEDLVAGPRRHPRRGPDRRISRPRLLRLGDGRRRRGALLSQRPRGGGGRPHHARGAAGPDPGIRGGWGVTIVHASRHISDAAGNGAVPSSPARGRCRREAATDGVQGVAPRLSCLPRARDGAARRSTPSVSALSQVCAGYVNLAEGRSTFPWQGKEKQAPSRPNQFHPSRRDKPGHDGRAAAR